MKAKQGNLARARVANGRDGLNPQSKADIGGVLMSPRPRFQGKIPKKLALGLDPRVITGFRKRSCAKNRLNPIHLNWI
jgi:hypothetical protein